MPSVRMPRAVGVRQGFFGALASVQHLKNSTEERRVHSERVQMVKQRLKGAGLPVLEGPSHIVPVHVGDPVHCKMISDRLLQDYGIYIQPINFPTVARGCERLRLTPTPLHTNEQIDHLVYALRALWQACELACGVRFDQAAE